MRVRRLGWMFSAPAASSPGTPLVTAADLPWLAAAVLTAALLRIVWVAYVNVDPSDGRLDDSVFYHNAARFLASTGTYLDAGNPTVGLPPAYPAALAVLYKLFGWHLILAKGANIAFAGVTVGVVYLIGRRIFDGRVAYVGALLLAFFPGQVYFSTLVVPATMFAMVFILVLLLALVWTVQRSEAHWWQVMLIGILVGVSAMVRTEGLMLAFVLVALWVLTARPWRSVARYTLFVTIGVAIALTPWTVRNAVQFQEFIPLRRHVTRVIATSLDPEFDRRVDPAREQKSLVETIRYDLTHPWEIPPYVSREVWTLYSDDSAGVRLTAHLRGTRVNRLGLPRGWGTPDYEPPLDREQVARWRRLADSYFFVAGAAALVAAAICLRRRNRASLLLILAALTWTILFGFIQPGTRYHFALGPVISIFAGAFLVFVWDGARVAWLSLFAQRTSASASASEDPPR